MDNICKKGQLNANCKLGLTALLVLIASSLIYGQSISINSGLSQNISNVSNGGSSASFEAKADNCQGPSEQIVVFDLTGGPGGAVNYSWRVGCPSSSGLPYPNGVITAVSGSVAQVINPDDCSAPPPIAEIKLTGTTARLSVQINNLSANPGTYRFGLEVYDNPGNSNFIINCDVTITVVGSCLGGACCGVNAVPALQNTDRSPGAQWHSPSITLTESNGTTVGLSWTLQHEVPIGSTNWVDATSTLLGLGLGTASGGPFPSFASLSGATVYLGGTVTGALGSKEKIRIKVTDGINTGNSSEVLYTIGNPLNGNTLIIPVHVADTRTSPPACPGTNLDPTAFKTEVDLAKAWLNSVSAAHDDIQPVLYSTTPANLTASIDLANYFNRTSIADDFKGFAEAVLAQLIASSPNLHNGITHFIFVMDDRCFNSKEGNIGHYSSMGSIPLSFGTVNGPYMVSVHGKDNTKKDVEHGLANHFELVDLFDIGPPLVRPFLQAPPTDWDILAKTNATTRPFNGAQPTVYSKFTAGNNWIDDQLKIRYFNPFFTAGNTTGAINLVCHNQAAAANEYHAVVISLENENYFSASSRYIVIEAREKNGEDANLIAGAGGIIFYLVDENTPTKYSPISLINSPAIPITAVPGIGGDLSSKYGIAFTSITPYTGTGTSGYTINVQYTPNPGADVKIHVGNPGWTSPDIDVDILLSGGNVCKNGDIFSTTLQNRIKASVFNESPIFQAQNVIAEFLWACPTPSNPGFMKIGQVAVGTMAPNSGTNPQPFEILMPNVQYPYDSGSGNGPTVADCMKSVADGGKGASHICAKVRITASNDVSSTDNEAQQNLGVETDCTGSPYSGIEHNFIVRNTEAFSTPVYYEADNIPQNWSHSFVPPSLFLAPGEEKNVTLKMTAPTGFPPCSNFNIPVTAYAPKGHTILPLGGISVVAQMRRLTEMTMGNDIKICDQNSMAAVSKVGRFNDKNCATIYANGCTQPPRPNALVKVMYQDPAGNPVIKDVMTDANGCYNDSYVVVEGGPWHVTAVYHGDKCTGGALVEKDVTVPIPQTFDQDHDGLADGNEIQGDDDKDGTPNHLDPDSDNDGIKDGDEPSGNYDCDSYPNVIDPDSDNDGTPDGQDQTPYGNTPRYRVFLSALYHRFDFDSDLPIKDGSGFNLRLGINLHPNWGVEGEFGLTSTEDADKQSGKVYNVNVNGLYYFLNRPAVSPYVTAGLGALMFKGFPNEASTFAVNAGVGAIATYPNLLPGFALRAEVKGHYGFSGYGTDGNLNLQYSIGLLYRFRTASTPCNIDRRIRESSRK